MSCQYKDALGVPGEGFHSYRLFNIAVGDVGLLVALALVFHFVLGLSIGAALVISFLLGIVAHRVFCVRTTIDKLLFPTAE